jgi:hypothetical protein
MRILAYIGVYSLNFLKYIYYLIYIRDINIDIIQAEYVKDVKELFFKIMLGYN